MRFRLLSIAAVTTALLGAAPAFAASGSTSGHDDVTYPNAPARFAVSYDDADIVTPDVTYPGPRAVLTNPLPTSARAALGYDDVSYPVAEETAKTPAAPRADERVACDCGRE